MRIAFLADIHGNLPALEAVIGDLKDQAPDAVYLVGDQINRCPWSNEVMELARDHGWPMIAGNHEWVVARLGTVQLPPPFENRARFQDLWWTWERLDPTNLATVRALPLMARIDADGLGGQNGPTQIMTPIRLEHGVPGNPFVGFTDAMPVQKLLGALAGVREPVVVCGHTHCPLVRREAGYLICNGGSVGMPYNGDPACTIFAVGRQTGIMARKPAPSRI